MVPIIIMSNKIESKNARARNVLHMDSRPSYKHTQLGSGAKNTIFGQTLHRLPFFVLQEMKTLVTAYLRCYHVR